MWKFSRILTEVPHCNKLFAKVSVVRSSSEPILGTKILKLSKNVVVESTGTANRIAVVFLPGSAGSESDNI